MVNFRIKGLDEKLIDDIYHSNKLVLALGKNDFSERFNRKAALGNTKGVIYVLDFKALKLRAYLLIPTESELEYKLKPTAEAHLHGCRPLNEASEYFDNELKKWYSKLEHHYYLNVGTHKTVTSKLEQAILTMQLRTMKHRVKQALFRIFLQNNLSYKPICVVNINSEPPSERYIDLEFVTLLDI